MTFEEELKNEKNPALLQVGRYLEERARTDNSIAGNLQKEKKSLAECWRYIKGCAEKLANNGCACIADDEVYNWAVHYYDEDDIKVESPKAKHRVESKEQKTSDNAVPALPEPRKKKKVVNTRRKKNELVEGQMSLFEV